MARLLFTARSGGLSTGNYDSLNLATHVGDDDSLVKSNRKVLTTLLSNPQLQFMNQVHGNTVVTVTNVSEPPEADSLITNIRNLTLVVLVADCLPILVDGGNCIAAIHVGRKGMVNGIIVKTISELKKLGGSNFRATIGPGICAKCYEVSEIMYEEIVLNFPKSDAGFRKLDLRSEVTRQLEMEGVKVDHVEICTNESLKHYSYRRNRITGRQCGAITL